METTRPAWVVKQQKDLLKRKSCKDEGNYTQDNTKHSIFGFTEYTIWEGQVAWTYIVWTEYTCF